MVKFITKFNKESTKSANESQMKNIKWVYVLFTVLFSLAGIFTLLGYFSSDETEKYVSDLIFGILLLLLGVGFKPLCVLLTKKTQSKLDKTMSILSDDTLETYYFFEDRIVIEAEQNGLYHSKTEATYKYIFQVAEEKEFFLFYISKIQCHVVAKKYLVEGSLNELTEYLKSNFDKISYKGERILYERKK